MPLPKSLTTVTPFSKTLGVILFVTLPFIGFFLGVHYQHMQDVTQQQISQTQPILIPKPTLTLIQTENWKTYTNNQFGFSLQYPPDMRVTRTEWGGWKGKEYIVEISNNKKNVILLYVFPNPVDAYGTPIKNIKQTFEGSDKLPPLFYNQQGYPAVRLESNYSPGTMITVHILKNNILWTMYNLTPIKDEIASQIVSTILSTFKFTQ